MILYLFFVISLPSNFFLLIFFRWKPISNPHVKVLGILQISTITRRSLYVFPLQKNAQKNLRIFRYFAEQLIEIQKYNSFRCRIYTIWSPPTTIIIFRRKKENKSVVVQKTNLFEPRKTEWVFIVCRRCPPPPPLWLKIITELLLLLLS